MKIDKDKLKKILPNNLQVFRELKGMTQYDLAAHPLVGKNQAQISHYENGVHVPEIETLEAIKSVLDFPLEASKLLDAYDARDLEKVKA